MFIFSYWPALHRLWICLCQQPSQPNLCIHGFGSKNAIRFIRCIYKDSFQIRHYSIIVVLEVLMLKRQILAIIIQSGLKILRSQNNSNEVIPGMNQQQQLTQLMLPHAPFVCHSAFRRYNKKEKKQWISCTSQWFNNMMFSHVIPAEVHLVC